MDDERRRHSSRRPHPRRLRNVRVLGDIRDDTAAVAAAHIAEDTTDHVVCRIRQLEDIAEDAVDHRTRQLLDKVDSLKHRLEVVGRKRALAGQRSRAWKECANRRRHRLVGVRDELRNVLEQAANDQTCQVCLNKPRETVFPCGHVVACEACAGHIVVSTERCPLCQMHVPGWARVRLGCTN